MKFTQTAAPMLLAISQLVWAVKINVYSIACSTTWKISHASTISTMKNYIAVENMFGKMGIGIAVCWWLLIEMNTNLVKMAKFILKFMRYRRDYVP